MTVCTDMIRWLRPSGEGGILLEPRGWCCDSECDGRGGSDREAPSTRLMELRLQRKKVGRCCEKGISNNRVLPTIPWRHVVGGETKF